MFGLFKSPSYSNPRLGQFTRTRNMWRGSIDLPGLTPVPLVLSGNKTEPDPAALAAATHLFTAMADLRPTIESALYEHYCIYDDAILLSELQETDEPAALKLTASGQVWQHTSLTYVAVLPLDSMMTVELGYTVNWDEEHTLGARFQHDRLLELNGSVLPP